MKSIRFGLCAALVGCAWAHGVSAVETPAKEKVLHAFGSDSDGKAPWAGLLNVNGMLYGTTLGPGGGTIFALNPGTGAEAVVYSFCSQQNCTDGATPFADLIAVKGKLYGTTASGGADGYGTVFSVDPSTGVEKVLYSFGSGTDGQSPIAALIHVKGVFYGTTSAGGAHGYGTAFSFDPSTGTDTVLHSFGNGTDGQSPGAALLSVSGTLYGTTPRGGTNGLGTVFSIDLATGAEKVLHDFATADGEYPQAGLIDVKGSLYGTTYIGGINAGTVFALDASTGAFSVVYKFCGTARCPDGQSPTAGLINVNGTLYGTTNEGGTGSFCGIQGNCGTVFSLDPETGAEKVVYSFCSQTNCADGENPQAGVIDVNGNLYGTTYNGGASGWGILFQIKKP